MVVAKQAPTMHALHIGLCLYEKVRHRGGGAAGVSRCGREEAGEEWQVAGMPPVRAS